MHRGNGGPASHHVGAPSPQLSTLAGTALQGTQRNVTTLWRALAKRLPTIRNATHYYAHDVQRLGRNVFEVAAAQYQAIRAQHAALGSDGLQLSGRSGGPASKGLDPHDLPGQHPSGIATTGDTHTGPDAPAASGASSDALGSLQFDVEAHYAPASSEDLGVSVRSAELQQVSDHGPMLVLCIEGGFAIFDVTPTGVFELTVELQDRRLGPVIAVRVVNAKTAVVCMTEGLAWYDLGRRTYRSTAQQRALSDTPASDLFLLKNHGVVVSAEYSQLTVYKLDDAFTEVRSLIAERPVVATSARWLAYCGESGARTASTTAVYQARDEPTATTVAKRVADGISTIRDGLGISNSNGNTISASGGVCGSLGAVTVHDVEVNRDVVHFTAHDHNIQALAFSCDGSLLATASVSGTSVHVWQVLPAVPVSQQQQGASSATGTVTLLFSLTRGMTSALVTSIAFSPLNAWVAFSTSVGTAHVYAVPKQCRHRSTIPIDGSGAVAPYAAPCLTATCRCRSAPMMAPVNPFLAFHPEVDQRDNCAAIYLTSSSASVAAFSLNPHGCATAFVQHLTEFSAGVDDGEHSDEPTAEVGESANDTVPTTSTPSPSPSGRTADFEWRSAIELRPHPAHSKLVGVRHVDFAEVEPTVAASSPTAVARVDDDWHQA